MLTRRDLLKLAGMAGTAAAAPMAPVEAAQQVVGAATNQAVAPTAAGGLQALTAAEADLLDAIVARLIPSDANGPGALEAQAVRYIDRALAGALSGAREAYRAGLAALDRYARTSRGVAFTNLSTTDQDSVLIDVETGAATGAGAGFEGSSAAFFALVRTHTWQGTFGDPFYGGNANFVGWDLIGYPGIRTAVAAEDQRLGVEVAPTHKSAYDHEMFSKATARNRSARPAASPRFPSPAPGSTSSVSRPAPGSRAATSRPTRSATTSATGRRPCRSVSARYPRIASMPRHPPHVRRATR
jgi:gluconate 2-dehydrogenase gamma chain